MINFIASNMNATVAQKQKILVEKDTKERALMLLTHLSKDLQMLELKNDIQSKVKTDIDKQQKE